MVIKNIKLNTNENTRDFSYITIDDQYVINRCSFIRSNDITNFSLDNIDILKKQFNLKTVIDLRDKNEVLLSPNKIKDIKYYNIPLFEKRKKSKNNNSNKQKVCKVPNVYETYLDMVRTRTAKKQLKKILKILMSKRDGCILFHCTFGKDRTGLISFLLLHILHASIDDIKKDYLYSNIYLEPIAIDKYNYYLEKSRDVDYSLKMKDVFMVKEEYLDYIINYMIEKCGSIDNYIKNELGINDKKIKKFRDRILIKK